MPNHIKNRLELKGDENRIKELVNAFTTKHPRVQKESYDGGKTYIDSDGIYGWHYTDTNEFKRRGMKTVHGVPAIFKPAYKDAWVQFPDFNKIKPRPEELNIDSTGWTMSLENEFSRHETVWKLANEIKDLPENQRQDACDNFVQGFKNFVKYGYPTWYGWAVKEWGTKWNSYQNEEVSDCVFLFETAWSGVVDLIREIADKFEDIEILYEYSDEDTGCNCGKYHFHNGILTHKEISNNSTEAYELAFKLRPNLKEHYELVDGNYSYIEDEE